VAEQRVVILAASRAVAAQVAADRGLAPGSWFWPRSSADVRDAIEPTVVVHWSFPGHGSWFMLANWFAYWATPKGQRDTSRTVAKPA
jgi:hypothetical protein